MRSIIIAIVRVVDWLNWLLVIISAASILFMIAAVLQGVFMRYIIHKPQAYSVEIARFSFMAVTACALAYTQKLRGHVSVDLLVMHLPIKAQKTLEIISHIIFFFYALVLVWVSLALVSLHISSHMKSYEAELPLWSVSIFFLVGACMLCLQLLVDIGKAIYELKDQNGEVKNHQPTF